MADTNRLALGYAEEVTFGTTPAGALNEFRFTGESLKPALQTARSAEVRPDRMTVGILRTGMQAAGSVSCELSYLSHDAIIRGALFGAAYSSSSVILSASTAVSAVGTQNRLSRSSGDWTSDGFTAGSWIRVSGFANAANNGVFKINSSTTANLVLTGATLVTESAGPAITVKQASMTVGGTTQASFSLEKQFTDNSNDYEILTGCLVDSWNLAVPVSGPVTHEFGFVAQDIDSAAATAGTGTLTAVSTAPVIPAVTGVTSLLENYSTLTASGLTIGVRNNLRPQNVVGTLAPTGYGKGAQDVEGTVDVYYASATLMNKALDQTASSLAVVFGDTSGNYLIVDIPAIKYVDGERIGGGRDTDIIARMRWQAYRATTSYDLCQIRYGKIAA